MALNFGLDTYQIKVGIVQVNIKSGRKMSDVRLLFHALLLQVVKLVACQAKSTTNIQAIYLFPYSSNSMMKWYGVIIVLTSYMGRLLHCMQAIMHVAVFLM